MISEELFMRDRQMFGVNFLLDIVGCSYHHTKSCGEIQDNRLVDSRKEFAYLFNAFHSTGANILLSKGCRKL
jgi:hypothetical protein